VPLADAGAPRAALFAMREANLVELRSNDAAGGEEYAELVGLTMPYVCAPCPLARESMAAVLLCASEGERM
jgi:hypothetical protein